MKKEILSFVLLTSVMGTAITAQAQQSQVLSGGSTTQIGYGRVWDYPNGVLQLTGDYAMIELDKKGTTGEKSKGLRIKEFNFAIPSNATITGYEMSSIKAAANSNVIKDNSIRLFQGGTVIGNNMKKSAYWASIVTITTYGSSTDLWGTSLTPSQVNSSSFGVALSCQNMDLYDTQRAAFDLVTITVYYTTGSHKFSQTHSSNEKECPISVAPNPAANEIQIATPEEIQNAQISIYNLQGQLMFQQKATELAANEIVKTDVSKFTKGEYLVQLVADDKLYTKKFIKQ